MAAWLIPAVKAILPFISPIVSSALPVFTTRKSDEAAAAQASVLQQHQLPRQLQRGAGVVIMPDVAVQVGAGQHQDQRPAGGGKGCDGVGRAACMQGDQRIWRRVCAVPLPCDVDMVS